MISPQSLIMRSIFLCLIVVMTGFGYHALSQVIHVPGDRLSIQEAIEEATKGDTVLIEEGTYFENINFLGKEITVASLYLIDGDTSHISRTILNGSRSGNPDTASVVTMWSGEDTTSILCGLTITGGKGTLVGKVHKPALEQFYKKKYIAGGGILIYNSGGKIIHNIVEQNHMIFRDGVRGSLGSGILAAVKNYNHCIIRNNIIRNNSSHALRAWGGGICIFGGLVLVEHNSILNNKIEVDEMAAASGIYIENEKAKGTFEEVVIRNNLITGNKVFSNQNFAGGGGLALAFVLDAREVQIYNNVIANNEAGHVGGGLYSYQTWANIFSNLIFNNKAGLYGVNIGTEGENDLDMNDNHLWTGDSWIATYDGLAKLCIGQIGISGIHPNEGIRIPPFEKYFSINPTTGEILFGKREGMITFDPEEVPLNGLIAPSVILDYNSYADPDSTSVNYRTQRTLRKRFILDLKMEETFTMYNFASLDFASPPNSLYRFYMKGSDQDTLLARKTQVTSYGDLKQGRYTFWSAKVDSIGMTSPDGITLDIRVHPPWYRSGWFISGIILFLVLLFLGLVRIRTARLKREKEALRVEVENRTRELREKNEQIMEMERLKTRFFTDVSHEIRTPLSLITGPLDQLIQKEHPDPETRDWLTMIRRNSLRLLQMVNQLLDISRLDSGNMKLVLERSDVLKHLRVLVGEFRSLAESRKIRFIIDITGEEMFVLNDRDKITKVVSNLLSNAFKFTPEDGIVTCRVRIKPGDQIEGDPVIRLIVADTGAGIPMAEREKIFTRFYRAPLDQYKDAGGTGIGLALTRELIHLMKGEIVVKSIQGKGSIFLVSIPLGIAHLKEKDYLIKNTVEQREQEIHEFRPTEKEIKGSNKIGQEVQILIVEDNDDLRTFIRENLTNEFQITEAVDGNEGLLLAQSNIPDLIISDVMMPEMDGMELCKQLKSTECTSHIPVIMLTAKSASKDKIEGLEMGAVDYIFKPFEIEELRVRIRNLLEQRERLRKKYTGMIGMDWGAMEVTTLDEQFLKKLTGFISEHIHDFDLDVSVLKEEMSMSREHLFRKLKALTGESPSTLIRVMRLKSGSICLLKGEENSITKISLK